MNIPFPGNLLSAFRRPRASQTFAVLVLFLMILAFGYCAPGAPEPASGQNTGTGAPPEQLHQPFDILLQLYVKNNRFDYAAIHKNQEDLQRLRAYVQTLEKQDPSGWERAHALAYWINLYNAATLMLVLDHYPVKSIKDIGGLFSSPWKKEVVTVNGQKRSLDEIENAIIRKQFQDARIHFALNCASLGCPPLASRAYTGDQLEAQLEAATARVLNDTNWVRITPKALQLSRIFDWYEEDFVKAAGSVREFIARYRRDDRDKIWDKNRKIEYLDYNWQLNQSGV